MPTQREAFQHFDMIAATKPGANLMVCEPVRSFYGGDAVDLPSGTWIRVDAAGGGGVYGKAAIEGRVTNVFIREGDFWALDRAPTGGET